MGVRPPLKAPESLKRIKLQVETDLQPIAFRLVAKGAGLKYSSLEIRSPFLSPLEGIKAGTEGVTPRSLLPLKRFFNRPSISSNNKGNRTRLICDCDGAWSYILG